LFFEKIDTRQNKQERTTLAHHHEPVLKDDDTRRLGAGARSFGLTAIVVGLVALAAAVGVAQMNGGGWERFGYAYVTNYSFFLSITLGGLFMVLITHLFRAGWVVAVRRIAEVIAANMPVMAVLFVPILLYVFMGNGMLYPWALSADGGHGGQALVQPNEAQIVTVANEPPTHGMTGGGHVAKHGDEAQPGGEGESDLVAERKEGHEALKHGLIPIKRAFLNNGFFTARWVFYLLVWSGLGLYYLKNSVAQESGDGVKLTRRLEKLSAPGTLLFALTITFAAFDLLMSLDPVWFSTMWGVYYFIGSMMSTVATMILALLALQRFGYLPSVSVEHYHDLGKLLFMTVFFWGYIAFSQFMLIWYGNLAEETYWFELRGITTQSGNPFNSGWTVVALVLLFGHLFIPFLGLLSRWVKRSRKFLAFWAIWLLVMHWVDQWWVVMPNYASPNPPVPTVELLCLVGIGGVAVGTTVLRATRQGLIASGDPRLGDSLGHVNPY
jgi:hypothetical protein